MHIHIFALPRSGSTFVQQVMWNLVGKKNVIKYHHWVQRVNMITYRNFFDGFISWSRIILDKDDFFIDNTGTVDKLLHGRKNYLSYVGQLLKYINWMETEDFNPLILCYEKDMIKNSDGQSRINNYDVLLTKISDYWGIQIDEKKRLEIIEDTNFDRNKNRTLKLKSWVEQDDHLIRGRHVFDGGIDIWRKYTTDQVAEYIVKTQLTACQERWDKAINKFEGKRGL